MSSAGNNQLDTGIILEHLSPEHVPASITVLDSIDSTNQWCRSQRQHRELPFLCLAEQQTAGRGRRGRPWVSGEGGDIIFSYTRRFMSAMDGLGNVSLAAGLAVKQCLETAGIDKVELKWPNDVLVNGGKIAGVLIESVDVKPDEVTLIIGIGINVTPKDVPAVATTCVQDHVGTDVARESIIAELLSQLERLASLHESSPVRLHDEISNNLDSGRSVSVLLEDGGRHDGIMQGVNLKGEIRVLVGTEIREFNSADVSLQEGDRI